MTSRAELNLYKGSLPSKQASGWNDLKNNRVTQIFRSGKLRRSSKGLEIKSFYSFIKIKWLSAISTAEIGLQTRSCYRVNILLQTFWVGLTQQFRSGCTGHESPQNIFTVFRKVPCFAVLRKRRFSIFKDWNLGAFRFRKVQLLCFSVFVCNKVAFRDYFREKAPIVSILLFFYSFRQRRSKVFEVRGHCA